MKSPKSPQIPLEVRQSQSIAPEAKAQPLTCTRCRSYTKMTPKCTLCITFQPLQGLWALVWWSLIYLRRTSHKIGNHRTSGSILIPFIPSDASPFHSAQGDQSPRQLPVKPQVVIWSQPIGCIGPVADQWRSAHVKSCGSCERRLGAMGASKQKIWAV